MNPGIRRAVWILNTLGFIFYLVWLSTLDARATLRSQDGIIFYLPCVPFLFVYMLLINPKPAPKGKPWWQSDEDYAREQQLEKQNDQDYAHAKLRGSLLRQGAWWWAFRNDKDRTREPPDKRNDAAAAPDAPPTKP